MAQELVFDNQTRSAKDWAFWLYLGHGLSVFFTLGAASFIPLILNYIKRDDSAGTFVHSHHGWMIRSFWWYLVWIAVGWMLFITIFGIPLAWLVWVGAWLWKIYRLIRGITALNNNAPVGNS
ncbi:hypothetical protein SAMN05518865_1155 [Duganella sp. CF458]|uniref:DUF4870 family protein n=1 Tax=Duganella sp. CF458 TaxID=1884368 RepID=UPI0008ECF498|nr:DUF4870 domain-containing protein [Duganella sp. CF458]SFG63089.1 hypothetical protein SAMN05518865_1155 [Duganella sp. CF458]